MAKLFKVFSKHRDKVVLDDKNCVDKPSGRNKQKQSATIENASKLSPGDIEKGNSNNFILNNNNIDSSVDLSVALSEKLKPTIDEEKGKSLVDSGKDLPSSLILLLGYTSMLDIKRLKNDVLFLSRIARSNVRNGIDLACYCRDELIRNHLRCLLTSYFNFVNEADPVVTPEKTLNNICNKILSNEELVFEDIFNDLINYENTNLETEREAFKYFDFLLRFLGDSVVSSYKHDLGLEDKVYDLPDLYLNNLVIVSDLHGDRESFMQILFNESFFDDHTKKVVFLGDYIDRGDYQLSVLIGTLLLKYFYPQRVILLKGNHEYFDNCLEPTVSDNGYPMSLFVNRYPLSEKTKMSLSIFFDSLPGVVKIGHLLLTHGGIPRPEVVREGWKQECSYPNIDSVEDLKRNEDYLYQMAWSRAQNKKDVYIDGNTGFAFANKQFELFMDAVHCSLMIRGHCVVPNGYEIPNHFNNRLITIHSTGKNPDSATMNSYYDIDPCYATIRNKEFLLIKRVYRSSEEDPVVLETLSISRAVLKEPIIEATQAHIR